MISHKLLISLVIYVFLALLLAACTVHPPPIQSPSASPTPARNVTPAQTLAASPSPKIALTATKTPTLTLTPRPSSTRDLSPITPSVTIGKGLISDIVRSADNKLIAILEDAETENSRLRWLDAATGEELVIAKPGYSFGLIGFSSDAHWLLAYSVFGADAMDNLIPAKCIAAATAVSVPGLVSAFSADNHYLSYTGGDYTSGGPYHFVSVFPLGSAYNFVLPTPTLLTREGDYDREYPILNPSNYHTMSPPAISPDDRWLAAGYHDSGIDLLYVWGLKTGVVQYSIPHIAEINSVDFSPDGVSWPPAATMA